MNGKTHIHLPLSIFHAFELHPKSVNHVINFQNYAKDTRTQKGNFAMFRYNSHLIDLFMYP